jgi:hypothetical protein
MFLPGGTYKHRNFLDVEMKVIKISYMGPKRLKVKVLWLCRGMLLGEDKVIMSKFKKEDWSKVA